LKQPESARVKSLKRLLADRMKARRTALDLTQEDIAVRAHMQKSAISQYELAKRLPYVPNLIDLCDALECSADYLIGRAK
jgi:transcriptional regulator with XRE-family HTH domain